MATSSTHPQHCPRCQQPVAPGAAACPNCGLAVEAFGREQQPGATTFYDLPPTVPVSQPPFPESFSGARREAPAPAPPPQTPPGTAALQAGTLPGAPASALAPGGVGSGAGAPAAPNEKQPSNKRLKAALIILIILLLLSGGLLTYLLTRPPASSTTPVPQPTLTIMSDYHEGSTLAGATGTILRASGQQFAPRSAILFLLDEQSAPDAPLAQSDVSGSVTADLTITANWSIGNHIITAKDAEDHTTQTGVTVDIVPQGEANTPGPNGAPPDDQNFTLNVTIQRHDVTTGMAFPSINESLTITGQPDPDGGKVCQAHDDGQPHQISGDAGNGVTYQETIIWQCDGSYKGGMLVYTETAISDHYVFSDGAACTATAPYIYQQLQGSFTSANSSMGSYRADAVTLHCTQGIGETMFDPQQGTWNGTR